jgi:hypothetical protein
MQAVEFETTVDKSAQIQLPAEVPAGVNVKVVVMWETGEEENEVWRQAGRRNAARFYGEEDAIYDELADDPPTR